MTRILVLAGLSGMALSLGCNTQTDEVPVTPDDGADTAPAPVPDGEDTAPAIDPISTLSGVWELTFEDGSTACMWITDGRVASWQVACDTPDVLASPFTFLEFDGEQFTARFAITGERSNLLLELIGSRTENDFFFVTLSIEKDPSNVDGVMARIQP